MSDCGTVCHTCHVRCACLATAADSQLPVMYLLSITALCPCMSVSVLCVYCIMCLSLQVTAAYSTASNEVLLQHYGFVDMENTHDVYTANALDFIEQTAIDQPNEEQLQAVQASPALSTALIQVYSACHCIHLSTASSHAAFKICHPGCGCCP